MNDWTEGWEESGFIRAVAMWAEQCRDSLDVVRLELAVDPDMDDETLEGVGWNMTKATAERIRKLVDAGEIEREDAEKASRAFVIIAGTIFQKMAGEE